MKKISLIFTLILTMAFFSDIKAAADEETDFEPHRIQMETLADSKEAEEFNLYREDILNYINTKIKEQNKMRKSSKLDSRYDLLTIEDIDFTDTSKVRGYKFYGTTTQFTAGISYDSFLSSFDESQYFWNIIIRKNDSVYKIIIKEEKYAGDSKKFSFGDKWCISLLSFALEYNDYALLRYDTDVIQSNIEKLLKDKNETSDNIQVVFASLGDYCSGAVIFADGTAKYIYCKNFRMPIDFLRSDTPENIIQMLEERELYLYFNGYHYSTDIRELYSYNMIMFLINICEKYR